MKYLHVRSLQFHTHTHTPHIHTHTPTTCPIKIIIFLFVFLEERLQNFDVLLSNYSWPPHTRPPSGPKMRECWHQLEQVGDDINLTCTSQTYGRYMYITLLTPGDRYMTLCDVRVYTLPTAIGSLHWRLGNGKIARVVSVKDISETSRN